jgi:hypothetical protein
MEGLKSRTTYIAVEISNDGFGFERLWTCRRSRARHWWRTPRRACSPKNTGNLYRGAARLALCGDRLPPRLLTVEEQSEVDQYLRRRYQQKTA